MKLARIEYLWHLKWCVVVAVVLNHTYTFLIMINLTPIGRLLFALRAGRADRWASEGADIQRHELRRLLKRGEHTEYGREFGFDSLRGDYEAYRRRVPLISYEEIRGRVMEMIALKPDVLWPGVCRNYAQSSGTSGGKSKYIPVTGDSLSWNHFRGSADVVGHYLRATPGSRLFAGKGLILGGSFANELKADEIGSGVKIGDLSATLIDHIPRIASGFRIPTKETALLADWSVKLPKLAQEALKENVTNLSGVPSWFLTLLHKVLEISGKTSINEVWPNLEVFFHGGISFTPYRDEYEHICDMSRMHFVETYNASEGFFACAQSPGDDTMLLLLDCGIFYEFIPVGGEEALPLWEVTKGEIYELVLTAANGLWRYRLGDTVKIESVNPVKISIAGRTKSYINAFGEEVMEHNTDHAIAAACHATDSLIANYTVAPVYAHNGKKGRHEWVIEWQREPTDLETFARVLDESLQSINSDYQAKRSHTIFLDGPLVRSVPSGTFDKWLRTHGTGKLGGQRKVPRLSNDRSIVDSLSAGD